MFYKILRRRADNRATRRTAVPSSWTNGVVRCAYTFVDIWKNYGQLGQFVNADNRKIIVGGSFCSAMAWGGLALCARLTGCKVYLDFSKRISHTYYEKFSEMRVSTTGTVFVNYQNKHSAPGMCTRIAHPHIFSCTVVTPGNLFTYTL